MKLFNVGDLVSLKSGSPIMTVEAQDKDKKVLCVWFNKKGEKCNSSFFSETLNKSSEDSDSSVIEENKELSTIEKALNTEEASISPESSSTEKPKTRKSKKNNAEQPSFD